MASKDGSGNNRDDSASSSHTSDTAEHIQKHIRTSATQNKSRDGLNSHGQAIVSRDQRVDEKPLEQDGSDADRSSGHKSADDEQTVLSLYQRCPNLWEDFNTIVDCLDKLDTQVFSTHNACALLDKCVTKLLRTHSRLYPHDDNIKDLGQFAAVTGFVGQSVAMYRQVLTERDRADSIGYSGQNTETSFYEHCLANLRSLFLNFSLVSMHFTLQLFHAGYLQDILQILNNIQQMAVDTPERRNVFLCAGGALHNWCRHPEVFPLVKQSSPGIVAALAPFCEETSQTQLIPATTLMVLSFVADDDQLKLLRLHSCTLQYLLEIVQKAVELHRVETDGWRIDAILCGVLRMVRYEFNRRLLTAYGTTKTLERVLATPDRSDGEKQTAVNILHTLAEDPHNLEVFKNDRELTALLRAVTTSGPESITDSAKNLLSKIQHTPDQDCEDRSSSSCLDGLLAEELNMLCILGMGEVEYVMDRLTEVTAEGGGSNGTCCLEVLQALTELVCRDDGCRREIMARGALDQLTKVLQNGENEEKPQAARILLVLSVCEENREFMKSQPDLMVSLSDATVVTDNVNLAQTASNILQTFGL